MSKKWNMLICLIVYTLILSSQGLQLSMQRFPGQDTCGELQCWNDAQPDGDIFSTTSISIYEVTPQEARIKLASFAANIPGLYINQSKVQDLSGSAYLSRYSANLSLSFRNDADCESGTFMCEVEFVNTVGQVDTVRQTTDPVSSSGCSCSALSSQVSQLSQRLGQVESDIAGLRLNKTLLEAELTSLRQLNALLESNYNSLSRQVSLIQSYLNATSVVTPAHVTQAPQVTAAPVTQAPQVTVAPVTQAPISSISTCSKGVPHTNPREKFILWNNVEALCDTETDGGGWVIIQRRTEGDVNFYQDWDTYKNGFGTPDTDFWIGNEIIHTLTSQSYNELRVDMVYNGVKYYAHYSVFNVDNEVLSYRMTVTGYSGNAGDSLAYHNGMMFTTLDRDNDKDFGNCATHHTAAWWFNACYRSNLNGIWGKNAEGGVIWQGINTGRSLSFTEMKLRHV